MMQLQYNNEVMAVTFFLVFFFFFYNFRQKYLNDLHPYNGRVIFVFSKSGGMRCITVNYSYVCFRCLGLIDELLRLVITNSDIMIGENITDDSENFEGVSPLPMLWNMGTSIFPLSHCSTAFTAYVCFMYHIAALHLLPNASWNMGHPVNVNGKSCLGWCSAPYDWNSLKLIF